MKKPDYTARELVNNRSFRRMVEGTASPEEIRSWSDWMEKNEENRKKAKKAASKMAGFNFLDPAVPDLEKEWSRLSRSIPEKTDAYSKGIISGKSALVWIYRAAAAVLLIGIVGLTYFGYSQNQTAEAVSEQIVKARTIATEKGEQKTLTFSNGSKIVLNSNSMLTYKPALSSGETIDVTLQGEAYFEAESQPSRDIPAFAVATPYGVIEDIGTEFLVTVRHDSSRIVLQEGRVKVHEKSSQEGFHVNKGEIVEFSKAHLLKRETVNPTFYTSWATGFMQFDHTEIQEFANYVERRFGVRVQVVDSKLAGITVDGAVYFKSLEGLVRSVSDVVRIPVYQSENRDTVYIGDPYGKN